MDPNSGHARYAVSDQSPAQCLGSQLAPNSDNANIGILRCKNSRKYLEAGHSPQEATDLTSIQPGTAPPEWIIGSAQEPRHMNPEIHVGHCQDNTRSRTASYTSRYSPVMTRYQDGQPDASPNDYQELSARDLSNLQRLSYGPAGFGLRSGTSGHKLGISSPAPHQPDPRTFAGIQVEKVLSTRTVNDSRFHQDRSQTSLNDQQAFHMIAWPHGPDEESLNKNPRWAGHNAEETRAQIPPHIAVSGDRQNAEEQRRASFTSFASSETFQPNPTFANEERPDISGSQPYQYSRSILFEPPTMAGCDHVNADGNSAGPPPPSRKRKRDTSQENRSTGQPSQSRPRRGRSLRERTSEEAKATNIMRKLGACTDCHFRKVKCHHKQDQVSERLSQLLEEADAAIKPLDQDVPTIGRSSASGPGRLILPKPRSGDGSPQQSQSSMPTISPMSPVPLVSAQQRPDPLMILGTGEHFHVHVDTNSPAVEALAHEESMGGREDTVDLASFEWLSDLDLFSASIIGSQDPELANQPQL